MIKLVYIEWKDSVLFGEWLSDQELKENFKKGSTMKSLGFLIDEDNDFVFISQSIFGSRKSGSLKIPKACIEKITPLNIKLAVAGMTILVAVFGCYLALHASKQYIAAVVRDEISNLNIIQDK